MLLFEKMTPTQAIQIIGAEQFSKYIGYAHTFRFSGFHQDNVRLDS